MPADAVTIKVISNRIREMTAAVEAAVVRQVSVSTYDVEARAKELSPVLTGTLRRSIHSVFTNGGLTGICGPSVGYSAYVEFGTRHRAARPYMRPAAEYVLPRFAAQLKALLAGLK